MRRGIVLAAIGFGCFAAALALKPLAHHTRGTVMLSPGESFDLDGTTFVLKSFEVPKYPSGKPKQFVSEVLFLPKGMVPDSPTATNETRRAQISVNHPLRLDGWWIYQYSYDRVTELSTELLIVRDRWLPLAAVGALLMVLGALWNCREKFVFDGGGRNTRLPIRIVHGALLSIVPLFIVGRSILRAEPIPALQSPLLAPHVAAYVASYIILLFAAVGVGRRLMPLGFLMMTLGLVAGGVWGKICWGDFWQYDPKEVSSLATWLVYLAYFAFARVPKVEHALRILGAVSIMLTLLAVNYLRIFSGLHSYA